MSDTEQIDGWQESKRNGGRIRPPKNADVTVKNTRRTAKTGDEKASTGKKITVTQVTRWYTDAFDITGGLTRCPHIWDVPKDDITALSGPTAALVNEIPDKYKRVFFLDQLEKGGLILAAVQLSRAIQKTLVPRIVKTQAARKADDVSAADRELAMMDTDKIMQQVQAAAMEAHERGESFDPMSFIQGIQNGTVVNVG